MINSKYDEILVGPGLLPLVRGLIGLKKNKSVLVLEEPRFIGESYHKDFISNLEMNALKRIGEKYQIAELQNIEQFLSPSQVQFQTNHFRYFISNSSFDNIRELIRKFPQLLDATDLDLLYQDNPEQFNEFFQQELTRFESQLSQFSLSKKAFKFELKGPAWLLTVFKRFSEMVNEEYEQNENLDFKSLIHLLGVFAESKLKSFLPQEDLHYYFFKLLSPVYRVDEYQLTTQLLHVFKSLGGDHKISQVQSWHTSENKFTHLILNSFEGVVSAENVFFFGHLPNGLTFHVESHFPIYKKTQLLCEKNSNNSPSAHELIFITEDHELGTDCPFRVIGQNKTSQFYHYPYPELPGTKPAFYAQDMKARFLVDQISNGLEQFNFKLVPHDGVTLDLRGLRDQRKKSLSVLSELGLTLQEDGRAVGGFHYWGIFKYRSFGLLAHCYGVSF